jgi:uncharacterized protein YcfL
MKNYFIIAVLSLALTSCVSPVHFLGGSQLFLDSGVNYNLPIENNDQSVICRDLQPYARVNYRIHIFDTRKTNKK